MERALIEKPCVVNKTTVEFDVTFLICNDLKHCVLY